MRATMFVFSGLPGTGKTTLARHVARKYRATYLRIDTIEHGIKELCAVKVQGEGYRLGYRIAKDNLLVGNNVVIDCCNPFAFTRAEWNEVAKDTGSECLNIEIRCSDKAEHKGRAEARTNDIEGFELPTWKDIETREYEKWNEAIIEMDTAGRSVEEAVRELNGKIEISINSFT